MSPREELTELAQRFGTDKWGAHFYTPHYERHFATFRDREINLLEIGVGGYGDPTRGGESLRMWKAYFARARIYGIDIYDKRGADEERIRTFCGSQVDAAFLGEIKEVIGPLHIVIDDGSHLNSDVQRSFELLFPLLEPGGLYVIEDLQTSYWPEFGGHPPGDPSSPTSVNLLKRCVDGLNWAETTCFGLRPTPLDRQIVGLHFYHNLAFIERGDNDEPSNYYNVDGTRRF